MFWYFLLKRSVEEGVTHTTKMRTAVFEKSQSSLYFWQIFNSSNNVQNGIFPPPWPNLGSILSSTKNILYYDESGCKSQNPFFSYFGVKDGGISSRIYRSFNVFFKRQSYLKTNVGWRFFIEFTSFLNNVTLWRELVQLRSLGSLSLGPTEERGTVGETERYQKFKGTETPTNLWRETKRRVDEMIMERDVKLKVTKPDVHDLFL